MSQKITFLGEGMYKSFCSWYILVYWVQSIAYGPSIPWGIDNWQSVSMCRVHWWILIFSLATLLVQNIDYLLWDINTTTTVPQPWSKVIGNLRQIDSATDRKEHYFNLPVKKWAFYEMDNNRRRGQTRNRDIHRSLISYPSECAVAVLQWYIKRRDAGPYILRHTTGCTSTTGDLNGQAHHIKHMPASIWTAGLNGTVM